MVDQPEQTTFYYYQNPVSGAVSSSARSIQQLVKLLVPIREGSAPILSGQTLCLPINTHQDAGMVEATDQENAFGEWKPASHFDILREASCAQWHMNNPASPDSSTEGPYDCRVIQQKFDLVADRTNVRFFAPNITENQWLTIEELPSLRIVLDTIRERRKGSVEVKGGTEENGLFDRVENTNHTANDQANSQDVKDELERFLSSTAQGDAAAAESENDEDHGFESDGGTQYVKDPITGNWIHEALAAAAAHSESNTREKGSGYNSNGKQTLATPMGDEQSTLKKKKNKKAKFSKKNARQWVYISGLPTSGKVTAESLQKYFGKAGMLDLDPNTMEPKIKIYRKSDGSLKGDASICYARAESVDLALQILDESPWDSEHIVKVERAKFEAKEGSERESNDKRKRKGTISDAQRKVARLALRQAQDEGFGERLAGGRKGLRIIVVKHMLDGIPERHWEDTIQQYIQGLDADTNNTNPIEVEKITCVAKKRVVLLKFVEPSSASLAVEKWHRQPNDSGVAQIEAVYWDGVTDYTRQDDEEKAREEESRLDDFGKWLETHEELPPELRLQVAEK